MDAIDRRNFLLMSSMGTAALGLEGGAARAASNQGDPPSVVRMHGDGLDLTPAEFAACLAQIAADEPIEPDYYSNGGVVLALEREMAEFLGKERAVFLPTGTLANQLAVRRLAGGRGRVLLQEESHLYNDSGDCLSQLSGLQAVGLAPAEATFSLERVRDEVERASTGKVRTPVRALAIESPVRRLWGQVFDFEEMTRISAFARENGIGLHLDGARLFLAEPYTGVSAAGYAALFDTVYVSLWKYFNSGSGAILAGPSALLDDLFHDRRMFGGSLPHAWMYAAVAKHYLAGFRERFADAVERSEKILGRLESHPAFVVERMTAGTNVVRLKVSDIEPESFRQRLAKSSIDLPEPLAEGSGFKVQVNETWRARDAGTIADVMIRAASPGN